MSPRTSTLREHMNTMDDESSADVPKVPQEMSSQFNSALKRAREIAMKLQGTAPAVNSNDAIADEPPRKMAPDNEVDKKFLQAQMIAQSISQKHNIISKPATDYSQNEDETVTDSILIQSSYVGLVIGRGGETIRNFQERTQCKMYMIQDGEYANAPEKLLTFQGLKSRVEEAKRLIKDFLSDKDKYPSGPPGTTKVEVTVPQDCVGLIIGKGGETIKKISAETNCRVHFNPEKTGYAEPLAKNGERVCIFEGLPQEIQAAQQRVREIVEMVLRKNSPQTMNIVLTEGSELYEVVISANKAGMIVGRGGEFLQLIMQSTGTHIEFNKGVADSGQTRALLISGTKEQVDRARQMMVDKAGENNVNPLQPPTNVVVSYVPAQPAWSDPYGAASAYDPNMYYQQQGMWAAQAGTPTDPQTADPNVANYYANMTQEEYAAAWASYYQQYQQYAAYSAMGGGEMLPPEAQPPADAFFETAAPTSENQDSKNTATRPTTTNADNGSIEAKTVDENDEPTGSGKSEVKITKLDDESTPDSSKVKNIASHNDDAPPAAEH